MIGTWYSHAVDVPDGSKFVTGVSATDPWWHVDGRWFSDGAEEGVAGAALARRLDLHAGSTNSRSTQATTRTRLRSRASFRPAAAKTTAILAPLEIAQDLAGRPGQYRRLLVSALTKPADAFSERDPATMTPVEYDRWYCSPYISSISHQMQQELPGVEVRAIRQVAEGEGRILTRVGGLMWMVTIAALFAAALAVGATSATTVLERRSEIGLMKALGASHRAVGAFFVAEQLLLALVGGIAGYALGVVLARALGIGIFGVAPDASMDSFSHRSGPGGGGGACSGASCRWDAPRASIPLPCCGESEDVATRSMFLRILWKLLGASRGRLALRSDCALQRRGGLFGAAERQSGRGTETDAGIPHAWRECGRSRRHPAGSDAALADAAVMDRIAATARSADRGCGALSVRGREFRNAARDSGGHLV